MGLADTRLSWSGQNRVAQEVSILESAHAEQFDLTV